MTRAGGRRIAVGALVLAAIAALLALGTWQIERRAWKHALVARVAARLRAAPVPAPGFEAWSGIGKDDAYTRLVVTGRFANGAETFVQAATVLGSGYWVMTPLITDRGFTVVVNRGFVPPERRSAHAKPEGIVTVTGLLRTTEPGGGFLRSNDPAAGRWYSRDVAAIVAARHLGKTAPYFVDADASPSPWPHGGLTVVRFPDNHLVYALTWFTLAAMLAGVSLWRLRPNHPSPRT